MGRRRGALVEEGKEFLKEVVVDGRWIVREWLRGTLVAVNSF